MYDDGTDAVTTMPARARAVPAASTRRTAGDELSRNVAVALAGGCCAIER
jgi:hypothetical protein